jgi:hypothetical protein
MANYYGAARSNYVHIDNMPGLEKALAPFDIKISPELEDNTLFCLYSTDPDRGGWPGTAYTDDHEEIEFSIEESVMPYVREGECFVAMEAGAEKLRYITGYASAYVRRGDSIESTDISLDDIYRQARETLRCENITYASY